MVPEPYVLRADGKVHEADVRSVSVFHRSAKEHKSETLQNDKSYIVSASRDLTAHLIPFSFHGNQLALEKHEVNEEEPATSSSNDNMDMTANKDELECGKVFIGHTAYVNFALVHPSLSFDALLPSTLTHSTFNSMCVITGSNDNHVALWNAETMSLEAVLDGHSAGVCCGVIVFDRDIKNVNEQKQEEQQQHFSHHSHHNEEEGNEEEEVVELEKATSVNAKECGNKFTEESVLVTGDWSGVCHVFNLSTLSQEQQEQEQQNHNEKYNSSKTSNAFGKIIRSYTKHQNAIRGVAHLPYSSWIVSASGDKSVHVWNVHDGQTLAVGEHEHHDAIQCVVAIHSHCFATGSNDCSIKLWKLQRVANNATYSLSVTRTLHGHDSLVYGLTYNSVSHELISCSEDRTVLIWSLAKIVSKNDNKYISQQEQEQEQEELEKSDNTKITPIQCLLHPCVVWSVAVDTSIDNSINNSNSYNNNNNEEGRGRPTGDIVTAGADGVIRVWTRNDAFMASVEKLEALEENITTQEINLKEIHSSLAANSNNTNKINVDQLPTTADLVSPHFRKGAYEGEKLLVRNTMQQRSSNKLTISEHKPSRDTNDEEEEEEEDAPIEVYIWSNNNWEKVGTVVAGPEREVLTTKRAKANDTHKERHMYKDKLVDYLFNVDVQGTMLQLPYNRGESIFDCAQKFIDDHPGVVTQDSKEEIQNFLLQHVDDDDIALLTHQKQNSNNDTADSNDMLTSTSAKSAKISKMESAVASHSPSTMSVLPIQPWTEPLFIHNFQSTKAQHKLDEILAHPLSFTPTSSSTSNTNLEKVHHSSEESKEAICNTDYSSLTASTEKESNKNILIRLGNWPANNSNTTTSINNSSNNNNTLQEYKQLVKELFELWTHLSSLENNWIAIDALRYALYLSYYHDMGNHNITDKYNNHSVCTNVEHIDERQHLFENSTKGMVLRSFILHYILTHFYLSKSHEQLISSPSIVAESSMPCVVAYLRFATNALGVWISLVQTVLHKESVESTLFSHAEFELLQSKVSIESVHVLLEWSCSLLQCTQRRQESSVKAAIAGLLHNVSLYLVVHEELEVTSLIANHKSNQDTNEEEDVHTSSKPEEAAAMTVVKVVAQRLLFEPTGTPLIYNLLSTLLTIYKVPLSAVTLSEQESSNNNNNNNNLHQSNTKQHTTNEILIVDNSNNTNDNSNNNNNDNDNVYKVESTHSSPHASHSAKSKALSLSQQQQEQRSQWRNALIESGKMLLQHTLQSLAIGADVNCHAAARALLNCLS